MTIEHKILHLADRGLIGREDLRDIVGPNASREGLRLHNDGLMALTWRGQLALTERGVARLNDLDGQRQAHESEGGAQ